MSILELFTELERWSTGEERRDQEDADQERDICFVVNHFVDRLLCEGQVSQAHWVWNKVLELAERAVDVATKSTSHSASVSKGQKERMFTKLRLGHGLFLASQANFTKAFESLDALVRTQPDLGPAFEARENVKSYIVVSPLRDAKKACLIHLFLSFSPTPT